MAVSHSFSTKMLMACVLASLLMAGCSANFYDKFDIVWGDGRAKIHDYGNLLTVQLDKVSGSGIQSKDEYLYGKIDMQIKLVPGNSAGTVTAYYLKSEGSTWDEIDFEFLGNVSGQPYVLHTNVFCQGKGNREQQFYLWFDPSADFHTYSVLWNPQRIVFYVDGIPIREFKNTGWMPYPQHQPMRIYSTLWNADDWATRGGLEKTDWSKAPFVASYRNFNANACTWSAGQSSCGSRFSHLVPSNVGSWYYNEINFENKGKMKWARDNYMIYDYCKDTKRFPLGPPAECFVNNRY